MATPTIPNGEEYFFPIIYEGNGAGQRVGKFVPFTDNGTIDNSCIFNDGDSPKLAITPSSNGDRRTWTFSAWIKRGVLGQKAFFSWDNTSPGGGGGGDFRFDSSQRLQLVAGGGTTMNLISNRTFEDTSKYYHIYIKVDTTQSTTADRVEIYVDGDEITSFSTSTYPSQNKDFNINNTSYETRFGALNDNGSLTSYFDGYLAEVNFVDGTNPAVSTFGVTDTSTGRWIPKTLSGITYGTNGFRLKFQDSSALGDDTSGNGNDLTATNLASTDQTTDSPTQNFTTVDPSVNPGSDTISEGNLKTVGGSSTYSYTVGTMRPKSGKYYAEFKVTSGGGNAPQIGIAGRYSSGSTNMLGYNPTTYSYYGNGGGVYLGLSTNSATSWGDGYTDNDTIGVALDLDNNKIYFAKNNTWQNSSDPTTGANAIGIIPPENTQFGGYAFAVGNFEGAGGPTIEHNYGQRSFTYTPPTGYVALQQDNLPETAKGISGLVWTKNRDSTDNHQLYDSSRGKQKDLHPNTTDQEGTTIDGLQKFLAGGQQIEDDVSINTSGESYVSWNWVANGGTTATNNDGSVTSTVQANTTAGFSIVRWTGGGSAATVGHGLSQTPEWIFYKRTSASGDGWITYHKDQNASPANGSMQLNSSGAFSTDSTLWNNTAPTSSVISIGSYGMGSGEERTAWVWHSVEGFSKFGKYSANNSADGPFVYLGFKPKFLIIKANGAISWYIMDATRNTFNPVINGNTIDNPQAEFTVQFKVDFLSNGFKIRNDSSVYGASTNNSSYSPYIYMAFAEHPFVGDGTNPVTAR